MKLSLRTLMLCVAFIGVVTAALAQPSLFWMRVMFTASIGFFLLYAIAGAVAARGQVRSFWIGAAVFGGGYFVMLMDGRMIDFHQQASMLPRALLTQHLLDVLAGARGLDVRSGYADFKLWDPSIYQGNGGSPFGSPAMPGSGTMPAGGGFFDVEPEGLDEPASGGSASGSAPMPGSSGYGESGGTGSPGISGMPMGPQPGMSSPGGSSMGPPGMGSGMMPGAPPIATPWTYASYNHFLITGHCAFLILVGLGGGMLCRWTFGREEAGQTTR